MTNLFAVQLGYLSTNCYVVCGENGEVVLIDPGAQPDILQNFLDSKGLTPKAILLTHGHFDHIGAVTRFQNNGCKVYLHKADVELEKKNYEKIKRFSPDFGIFTPDVAISDGDIIEVCGMKFSVMHTPGHTAGSVCYIHDDSMFSGDTLFYHSIGRTDFDSGNDLDMANSLKKLFALDKDYTVYPGHGEKTSLFFEKQTNPYAKF